MLHVRAIHIQCPISDFSHTSTLKLPMPLLRRPAHAGHMNVTPLFRHQALQHRLHRDEGHPRLITPPGADLIAGLLVAALCAAVAFLATSDYTRKTTVPGYVEPGRGTQRIFARNQGIVDKVLVMPGQVVKRNQVVAMLSRSGGVSATELERMLTEFERQKQEITRRIVLLHTDTKAGRQQIEQQQNAIRHALAHYAKIIEIQQQEISQNRKTLDDAQPLYKSGRLSRLEWNRFNAALLDARKQLEHLAAQDSDKRDQLAELEMEMHRATLKSTSQEASLQQEISRIEQSRRTLLIKADRKVRASISGRIANVFVTSGEKLDPHRPIVSIVPTGAGLVAKLLVPSSAIGFVQPGQAVSLLYDAFPYQKFGSFHGQVVSVTREALTPGDLPLSLPNHMPFFEVIAAIDDPWVVAYGRHIRIKAGMTLKADIRLDHRSLAEWLLSPLYAIRNRAQ